MGLKVTLSPAPTAANGGLERLESGILNPGCRLRQILRKLPFLDGGFDNVLTTIGESENWITGSWEPRRA